MNETLNCKSILESIKKLSHSEQIALSEQVLKMLSIPTTNKTGLCDDLIDFRGEKPNCPHCGAKASSKSILKHGFDNGRQRYYCKECKRNFFATTNSVFARTRKNADTWRKFVELTISGASLHTCCIECHLAHQTAFVWRHKILNALQHDQDNRVLGGIIETDDMYISISYKGNHKYSKKFIMPRPAFKRGSDNRGQLSSRACVTCAYERNGQSYGEVLGKGQPTIAMFSHAFAKRIIPESIVLTDKSTGIRNYFENNASVELIQLLAHVKPKSMNADSYKSYNKMFNELQTLSDPNVAEKKIEQINSEIEHLNNHITSLKSIKDDWSLVNNYLNNATESVSIPFNSLIKSYNELKYVYEDIANSNITEGININIDNLYETLYSTVDVEEEIIDKSISELKLIVKKYLKENKNGNDETIEKISKCIIYLGELKKCREFEEKIELFEENALSQVYIIEIPTESTTKKKENDDNKEPTQEEKTSSLSESQAEEKDTSTTVADDYIIEFHNITVDEWNKQRRKDLAQFINIIKTLPDIDLLLETMGDTDEESKSSLKEYNAELENTLTEAYKLNREKLEQINPVEQAAKYLSSDFDFMAKFSFLIALFMDIASFLIGIFLYFVNDKKDDEEDKDVSVQKT